jgi:hypothetical protein
MSFTTLTPTPLSRFLCSPSDFGIRRFAAKQPAAETIFNFLIIAQDFIIDQKKSNTGANYLQYIYFPTLDFQTETM